MSEDPGVIAAVALLSAALGPNVRTGASLAAFTTFRVGGPAEVLVEVDSEADLGPVAEALAISGLPLLVVGQGSNLLVADDGVRAITVVLGSGFATLATDGPFVEAGAAVKLPVLARRTAAAGRAGLEWAVGVPGSVGGAVRMNAGGHGSDISASLVSARVATLGRPPMISELGVDELTLGYRSSAISSAQVVLRAAFRCPRGDVATSEAMIADIVRWRREHQPGGQNCGSVFTNPPGTSAGRLIDECGLKGLRVGSATVSHKHANFIQVDEQGRANDIWQLIALVRGRVHARHGIWLHPEVRTAGLFPPLPEATPTKEQP